MFHCERVIEKVAGRYARHVRAKEEEDKPGDAQKHLQDHGRRNMGSTGYKKMGGCFSEHQWPVGTARGFRRITGKHRPTRHVCRGQWEEDRTHDGAGALDPQRCQLTH